MRLPRGFAAGLPILVLVSACGAPASTGDPTVATPTPSRQLPVASQQSIGPSPSSAAASHVPPTSEPTAPTEEPEPLTGRPTFDVGLVMVTVADRVRVRSKPSTDSTSVRYEPVLPLDTVLRALEGPVSGSGYWWYRVELLDPSQHLFGGIREGWVAVADHDGAPWVGPLVHVTPGPPAPPTISGWPTVRRDSTVLASTGTFDTDTGVSVPLEVHGLLPGTEVTIEAEGDYEVDWMCGGGPEGELGAGAIDAGTTSGSDATRLTFTVGVDGIGMADPEIKAEPPATPCPPDFPGPMFTIARRWDDLRVRETQRFLELTPPRHESADTF